MMDSISELNTQATVFLQNAYEGRGNDLAKSIQLANKALSTSKKVNNTLLIAKSLNMLSLFYMIRGEFTKCIDMANEAIVHFEQLNDERGITDAKYNIAGVYYRTNNYHLGLVYMINCRSVYKKYKDYHNLSRVEKSLGTIYEYFGDQKNAIKSYQNAIDAAKEANDLNLESNAYNPLSGIYIKQGELEKALAMIEKSIAIKTQTGDTRGYAFAVYGRGKVLTATHQFKQAEHDFIEAIEIHRKVGDNLGLGMAYHKLGKLYEVMGELEKAKETLQKGLKCSIEFNTVIIKFKCYYLLYRIHKQEGETEKALEYLELYLKEKEGVINTQTLKVIENYELITKVESLEKEAKLQRERAEIIEKKNRAEEAARVRQEFLSNMSHELRTPLNAVIMITNLLSIGENEEERKLISSLKFASNHLLRIINDILDYTKLDMSKMSLEKHSTAFKPLLESIKLTYQSLAKEKNIQLLLDVKEGVAQAYELDDTKISQILGNLISNAIKFTDVGSVTLSVEKIKTLKTTDILRFKVIDTGVGIGENNFEEIFESFSQPKSITTKKHGGSGLGLAIVKKLVELHHSTILVDSKIGKGSTFYFDIEFKRTRLKKVAVAETPHLLTGKTVLLAEDNKVNAMVATKLLSNWGLVIELAENGLVATEKAGDKKYDFILMDIHMPEMNGYDATLQIRNTINPNTQTPIFALTADTTVSRQQEYINYFTSVLQKPIDIEKLQKALTYL